MRATTGVVMALALLGAACTRERSSGTEPIAWDRDACTACGMVISDHHFAAEVRGGPGQKLFRFDDVGCAAGWLAKQPWGQAPETKVWVARFSDEQWMDAKAASYREGAASPMGFNLAAQDGAGGLNFSQVTERAQQLRRH